MCFHPVSERFCTPKCMRPSVFGNPQCVEEVDLLRRSMKFPQPVDTSPASTLKKRIHDRQSLLRFTATSPSTDKKGNSKGYRGHQAERPRLLCILPLLLHSCSSFSSSPLHVCFSGKSKCKSSSMSALRDIRNLSAARMSVEGCQCSPLSPCATLSFVPLSLHVPKCNYRSRGCKQEEIPVQVVGVHWRQVLTGALEQGDCDHAFPVSFWEQKNKVEENHTLFFVGDGQLCKQRKFVSEMKEHMQEFRSQVLRENPSDKLRDAFTTLVHKDKTTPSNG